MPGLSPAGNHSGSLITADLWGRVASGIPSSRDPSLPPTADAVAGLAQAELVEMVVALLGRVEALEVDNQQLWAENQRLRAELAKNSGNSSKPPSRDPAVERSRQAAARRAKRSRDGKIRRPGKQPGGEGTTMAMVDSPDEIVVHAPEVCAGCGGSLADAEIAAIARRQVVDLPVVTPTVTEHQAPDPSLRPA